MNQAILTKVNLYAEELQLHYASPNRDLVTEIMQLDATQLSSLTYNQLSSFVLVLGQYMVRLQYSQNMCAVEHKLFNKTYEFNLNSIKFSREDIKGKTGKERDAWVLLNVPKVRELHDEVLGLEAKKMIVEGMVRAVEGLLNALKKEMSVRHSD